LYAQVSAPPAAVTSLAHSTGHAALALGPPGCRVGIDLEAAAPRAVVRLAALCFAPEEVRELEAVTATIALRNFYVHWTLKEAFAKAAGLQLLSALRGCVFSSSSGHWSARVPLSGPWRARVYAPRPGLVLAAVLAGSGQGDDDSWVCREWPPERTSHWPCLARLSSDSGSAVAAG
jgi:4'-phosphopantetheinyl transferase